MWKQFLVPTGKPVVTVDLPMCGDIDYTKGLAATKLRSLNRQAEWFGDFGVSQSRKGPPRPIISLARERTLNRFLTIGFMTKSSPISIRRKLSRLERTSAQIVAGVGKAPRIRMRLEKGSGCSNQGETANAGERLAPAPGRCVYRTVYDPRARACASGPPGPTVRTVRASDWRPAPGAHVKASGRSDGTDTRWSWCESARRRTNCEGTVQWRFLRILFVT
jgi:hypothetical protein